MYPTEYRYSKEHEWVLVKGDICRVGITDFAQEELGEVVFVELPEVGQTYQRDEEVGTIESVKAVAEIFTPVSGTVTEVNAELEDKPERLNDEPHGAGWLLELRLSDAAELDGLMTAAGYEEFIAGDDA